MFGVDIQWVKLYFRWHQRPPSSNIDLDPVTPNDPTLGHAVSQHTSYWCRRYFHAGESNLPSPEKIGHTFSLVVYEHSNRAHLYSKPALLRCIRATCIRIYPNRIFWFSGCHILCLPDFFVSNWQLLQLKQRMSSVFHRTQPSSFTWIQPLMNWMSVRT